MTFPPESRHTERRIVVRERPRGRNVPMAHSDGSVSRDALIYSGRLFQINGQANGESAVSRV